MREINLSSNESVRCGSIINEQYDTRSHLAYTKNVFITKTCPCNIQRFFSAVKIENFIRKMLIFFLFSYFKT